MNRLKRFAIILIAILFASFLDIKAQSGTLIFSNANTANLGTMLYDNKTYSTDISSIEIKVFNASSEANAASRTTTGSLVFVGPPDLNSTHPAIFSNNATTGTLVLDYTDSNRPKYIVLASTSGAEFRFSSVYVVEPDTWIKPPKIKFEGFRNGTSTGFVYLEIDQNNGEYEKTFDASYFPVNIFGNVDEVRISRGWVDEFIGNLDGFNNFTFSAPVSTYVNVSANTLGIGATENSTATFNISSNTSWTVSSNQTWITAAPTSGSNNSTVTLTAQANPSTSNSRSAIISVSGGNTITVTQPAASATLAVSTTSLNIGAAANSTSAFDITSNTSWSISKDQTWLSVSSTSGNNNGTITLTAQANPYATTRTATVSVAGVGTPKTVTITQLGASPTLSVSSNSVNVANTANSTGNFQITSNTTWNISSNQTWLTASPSTNTGSAWITLTANEDNPNATKRSASVTVSASGVNSQVITVEQDGTSTIFSVSPSTIAVGASAGSTSFVVTSNISWTTLIDQSWITITPTSGSGSNTVNVSYNANSVTSERTCNITVNGANGDKKNIEITQAGAPKMLSISKTSINLAETANNSATFDVTSNTSWSLSCDKTWISTTPTGGINNATVTVSSTEVNPLGTTRSATITISADGLADKTITVTQAAGEATLSVSSNSLNVSFVNNSTITFDITSNTDWAVESSQSWLSPSDVNGNGNKTITLTAAENTQLAYRYCIVTVKGFGVSDKVINVTQIGRIYTDLVDKTGLSYTIWSTQGQLHISTQKSGETVRIYNQIGKMILITSTQIGHNTIPLQTGLYYIHIGNTTKKIIIK